MLEKLILFPFGGNAREALLSVFAINAKKKRWDIAGFIDDNPANYRKKCLGIKVLGSRDMLKKYPKAKVLAVPAHPDDHLKRKEVIEKLNLGKERFATIIHPSATVSPDAKIGHNTLLMSNVVISCGTVIGSNCVILPNSVVLHDSRIGEYSCIGSNVSISGSVNVGSLCYIGSGTCIKEHVTIGDRSLVGIGSNVISDIDEGLVAVGNPAHVIRKV